MDYVDVQDLQPDYKRTDCPECGVERRFTRRTWDNDEVKWACQECGAHETLDIEIACPDCDRRMTYEDDRDRWVCRTCGAERDREKDRLIDRMTEPLDHRVGYLLGEPCPRCGAGCGIHADPDGTLLCRECEGIYWWSPHDEWWAYAEWLIHRGRSGRYETPTWIRVNAAEADP